MKKVITSGIMGVAVLVGSALAQTSATSSASAAVTARVSAARTQAAETLASILAETNQIPLELYPPGYLELLQGEADGTVSFDEMAALTAPQPQTPQPMDQVQGPPPDYAVIDLGTLGGGSSYATAINSGGEVAGYSADPSGNVYAFLYSGGPLANLGTLGGNYTRALGINDSGQVVGESYLSGGSAEHGFLYQNGSIHDIGTFPTGRFSDAYGINKTGQITGYGDTNGQNCGFIYQNGQWQSIGNPTGDYGFAINNEGQVAGVGPDNYAFLYSNGLVTDLGGLGGVVSQALGINNYGQVVGWSDLTGDVVNYAFLYSKSGGMQNIGTLPNDNSSAAYGINDGGQVVGTADENNGNYHAFIYQGGTMYDLNDYIVPANSDWTLQAATAINNSGQICGYGSNPQGQEHAFLLNPLPPGALLMCTNVQANTPPYGDLPIKEEGKNGLVVVTHGWTPKWETDPGAFNSWIYGFSNVLSERLEADDKSDWQVFAFSWVTNSWVYNPGNAIAAASAEGIRLGDCIATQNWSYVHLIAHSAGAELIERAAEEIKGISSNTMVQCTFLDPYVGSVYEYQAVYGGAADWSDCYLSDDITFGWTGQPLLYAYNADVTELDPSAILIPSFNTWDNPFEPCGSEIVPHLSGHFWPIEFYTNTVTENASATNWSYYDGFGYDLSMENLGSDWTAKTSDFPRGNGAPLLGYGSVTNLGPQSSSCLSLIGGAIAHAASVVAFDTKSTIESAADNVRCSSGALAMVDGPPVWAATIITPTNALNQVSFDAEFTSDPGAHGLLSVYWDTNLLGLVDEAQVQPGLQHYTMSFPAASAGTSHVLGFHLDPFAEVSSSISMTNITVGWAGVTLEPTLSIIGSTNGFLVFQLSGQEDNYEIQATTNLLSTNWVDLAVVANTTGTAEFTDQSSTNYAMKFYRAMAQ